MKNTRDPNATTTDAPVVAFHLRRIHLLLFHIQPHFETLHRVLIAHMRAFVHHAEHTVARTIDTHHHITCNGTKRRYTQTCTNNRRRRNDASYTHTNTQTFASPRRVVGERRLFALG